MCTLHFRIVPATPDTQTGPDTNAYVEAVGMHDDRRDALVQRHEHDGDGAVEGVEAQDVEGELVADRDDAGGQAVRRRWQCGRRRGRRRLRGRRRAPRRGSLVAFVLQEARDGRKVLFPPF